MGKTTKIIGILLCFALVIVILGCNSGVRLRGVYSADDDSNDSVKFISGSRITFDLDGENTISRRLRDEQIFTKERL